MYNGIVRVSDLLIQDIPTVARDVLTYVNSDGNISHPSLGHVTRVVSFLWYTRWLKSSGHYDGRIPFRTLTREKFLEFQETTQNDFKMALETPGHVSYSGTNSIIACQTDIISDFNRGVKRDYSAFNILREEKQWDNWYRHTVATAQAQNVGNVLDPKYVPQSPDEKKLFSKQQQYMFAIFLNVLKTDEGQSLARDPNNFGDAQTIFRKLCDYAETSTRAVHTTEDLMTYLTSYKIDKWTGTTYSFILHWREQVRIYHTLVEDAEDRYSPRMQQRMLQAAVATNPALKSIESTGNIINQALRRRNPDGSTDLPKSNFEEYVTLLKAAAQTYDRQFVPPTSGTRRSNMHSTTNDEHTIDFDVSDLMARDKSYDANLHETQWDQLNAEEKDLWDKFNAKAKNIITDVPQPTTTRPPQPPPTHAANLHKMSAHDFLTSYVAEQRVGSEGDVNLKVDERNEETPCPNDSDGETPCPNNSDGEQTPRVNRFAPKTGKKTGKKTTNQRDPELHPGDLRNVLASYAQYNTELHPSQYKANIHRVSIEYNGITYSVSKQRLKQSFGSLVDRGSNGGIGGNDVRIVAYAGRAVKVTGIGDHKLHNVPVVTAAGVTTTQHGPVVLILPQYAYTGKGKTIHSSCQMEANGQDVNDKSLLVKGGTQRITTSEGYVIPLSIEDGLAYMQLRPYTDKEWGELPHVLLTSEREWNPSIMDNGEPGHDVTELEPQDQKNGEMSMKDILDYVILSVKSGQDLKSSLASYLKVHNADDRMPEDGETQAQIYTQELQAETQFLHTFKQYIRERGALDDSLADHATEYMQDMILSTLRNTDPKTDVHTMHKDLIERLRLHKDTKTWKKRNMKHSKQRTHMALYVWVAYLMYVCFVKNYMSNDYLGWQIPLQHLTGSTPDNPSKTGGQE
jgi:hypothetical protein